MKQHRVTVSSQDQIHPRARKDKAVVTQLLEGEMNDYKLAELARLMIRYKGFPGARDIQKDLQQILDNWQLTEEQLYALTKKIHREQKIFSDRFKGEQKQDWT